MITRVIPNSVIAKQIKSCLDNFVFLEASYSKFLAIVEDFKKDTFNNIKQIYEKTKVNIYVPPKPDSQLLKKE